MAPMIRITFLLALLIAAAAIPRNMSAVDRAQHSIPKPMPEQPLEQVITEKLQESPGISADNIEVRIHQGVAILSGGVNNIMARDRASEVVQLIHGVHSVVNNLTIKTVRKDKLIKEDVTEMLNHNPTTAKWKVRAEVEDQIVTLKGVVDSWQSFQYVEQIVKRIKGVRGINNQLEVNFDSNLSDNELEREIDKYIKWDARIDDARVEAIVEDKTAILVGSVPTAYQKVLVTEAAHIKGIRNVDASNLSVAPEEQSTMVRADSEFEDVPGQIKQAIQRAMQYDPRIKPGLNIAISIKNGHVKLTGVVDNYIEKVAAGENAKNTRGVKRVTNEITVDNKLIQVTGVSDTDRAITVRIQKALQRDPYLTDEDIAVSVNNGVVKLNGSVPSTFEKIQAGKVASQVMGTIAVNNNLTLKKDT